MPEVTSYQPGTFCWFELATSDGAAAKEFYTSLLGWTADDRPMPEGVYTILQKNGRDAAALYENKQAPTAWMTYVSVASADESVEKAKSLGATVVAGPFDVMEHGRMAVLQDPAGAHVSLWQPRGHIGATVSWESGTVCWTELATRDAAAAERFYVSLFGWHAKHNVPAAPGAGPAYTELDLGGQPFAGMYDMPAEMAGLPSYWLIYIAVDDCDATAEKAKSLGGQVHVGPQDIPNVGRFAMIGDPQGAMFAVIKLNPR